MEYKLVIQENLDNGNIYIHSFSLDPCTIKEALAFRYENYHSDCVFVLSYCQN